MRLPPRFVDGHLVWSVDGGVWAVWRVRPVDYRFATDEDKLAVHRQAATTLTALPASSLLLGVCRRVRADEVIRQMRSGRSRQLAAWDELEAACRQALSGRDMFRRWVYLAGRLPDGGASGKLAAAASTAASWLGAHVGLPAPPPTARQVDRRRRQANELASRLSAGLALQPASAAEITWLYRRAVLRGTGRHAYQAAAGAGRQPDRRLRITHLADAAFKEGGFEEDGGTGRRQRRMLRIDTTEATAYQTFLVASDMPRRWAFPNGAGEWFAAADLAPWPVDWAARVRAVANEEARAGARKQARQLSGQAEQYEGEPAGAPPSLHRARQATQQQRCELENNPAAPELETTVVFSVAAGTPDELQRRAGELKAMYEGHDYLLVRPTGDQLALWRAMLPGGSAPRVCRDYHQWMLPDGLASGMPVATASVGDPSGLLVGYVRGGGADEPVLFDPAYGPKVNKSGSLGAFGALGSGKSYLLKRMSYGLLARGGRVVVLDRTASGEYAACAEAMPGSSQVVELSADAEVCLDPLQAFGSQRLRYTDGFLTLLCGTSPTDLEGATLGEAARRVAEAGGRLSDVVDELAGMDPGEHPEGRDLARKLDNIAASDLAQLAFGGGDPVRLAADYIVLWTPGLQLPDREVLLNEHLARQMTPEQLFSQACLYLVAAAARTVTFAEPDRLAVALFDEAWSLTSSMEGQQLLKETARDGRKHNAAAWLSSQHPADVGSDELAALLGNRLILRQASQAVTAALDFLGLPDSEANREEILELGSRATHEAIFRDVRGRIATVELLPALADGLHETIDTTPGQPAAA